jgi:hypothetical protein
MRLRNLIQSSIDTVSSEPDFSDLPDYFKIFSKLKIIISVINIIRL